MLDSVLQKLLNFAVSYGGRLVVAAVVLVVGFRLCGFVSKRLRSGKFSQKMDNSVLSILLRILNFVIKAVLVVTAISILGVPMSSVITVIATVGAAVGLALQGSLSNLAGGIMLLIFKPFRVGALVGTQEYVGTVKEIGLFYTTLCTADNKRVTLPNGTLMNSSVVNYTGYEVIRADVTFGVAYDSDIDRVRSVLLAVAEAHPQVLSDPAPSVYLTKQDESALLFTLRAWCKSEDYWTVQWELTELSKRAFDKIGVVIPFRQVDVHIREQG